LQTLMARVASCQPTRSFLKHPATVLRPDDLRRNRDV
jgi:hypothetical protein